MDLRRRRSFCCLFFTPALDKLRNCSKWNISTIFAFSNNNNNCYPTQPLSPLIRKTRLTMFSPLVHTFRHPDWNTVVNDFLSSCSVTSRLTLAIYVYIFIYKLASSLCNILLSFQVLYYNSEYYHQVLNKITKTKIGATIIIIITSIATKSGKSHPLKKFSNYTTLT